MHRAVVIASAATLLASCGGGDDTTTPPVVPPPPVNQNPEPGHVYNYAGNGAAGLGAMGRTPERTQLYWPQDVVFSPVDQSAIVIDWNNHRVIQVDKATNHFKLLIGVDTSDFGDPCPPSPQPCTDIDTHNAKLNHPTHVAFDANHNMVLCAWHNSELFLVDMAKETMDRFCGTGARPCYTGEEQTAVTACVDLPASVAFDPSGRLCFTDQGNMIIRMIDQNGIIHCIAGTPPLFNASSGKYDILQFGYSGDEGPATEAKLSFERGQIADPSGKICFDQAGNMYIADTRNNCVRRVDASGTIHMFAGHSDGGAAPLPGFGGDGSLATDASVFLNGPRDVAADLDGNVFIADTGNNVVRMVSAVDGTISSIGAPRPPNSEPIAQTQVLKENGALAANIHLTAPAGVEADSQGRVWIADTENNVIRVLYR